eukprot:TRINITY_DN1790_c0_g1_i3.p2 TRINITY_DN1790_c0_g1~~TRINITY_DN1790_c0_g1_i3.p2  ORF type:complete len:210 (+),score=-16.87 TRINITY_DN1790_c0_g1_i3:41-631(+)
MEPFSIMCSTACTLMVWRPTHITISPSIIHIHKTKLPKVLIRKTPQSTTTNNIINRNQRWYGTHKIISNQTNLRFIYSSSNLIKSNISAHHTFGIISTTVTLKSILEFVENIYAQIQFPQQTIIKTQNGFLNTPSKKYNITLYLKHNQKPNIYSKSTFTVHTLQRKDNSENSDTVTNMQVYILLVQYTSPQNNDYI